MNQTEVQPAKSRSHVNVYGMIETNKTVTKKPKSSEKHERLTKSGTPMSLGEGVVFNTKGFVSH